MKVLRRICPYRCLQCHHYAWSIAGSVCWSRVPYSYPLGGSMMMTPYRNFARKCRWPKTRTFTGDKCAISSLSYASSSTTPSPAQLYRRLPCLGQIAIPHQYRLLQSVLVEMPSYGTQLRQQKVKCCLNLNALRTIH